MICYLHEDLYNYLKNNPVYVDGIERLSKMFTYGDLSTFVSPILGDPAYDFYEAFPGYREIMPKEKLKTYIDFRHEVTDFYNNLPLPTYLKLIRETTFLTDDKQRSFNNYNENLQRLEKDINDLPEGTEKISCKIWFVQHKILFLLEHLNYSYFSPEVLELRKEILRLYKSNNSFEYPEETHITAIHNASDIFYIENRDNFFKDADALKYTYERLINALSFYEEMSLQKHPTEYMKNRVGYVKIYYHSLFYSYFILSKASNEKDFFDLDVWFEEKFNSIEFKYKDFNYIKLKYLWARFSGNFGFSNFQRAMSTLQEIYDIIVNNMQDKNYMGKKLNYLNSGTFVARFFALILSLRKLEKEYLNDFSFYLNKNQFNNLIFSKNEEIMIAIETEPHNRYMKQDWNYDFVKTKLAG